MRSVFALPGGFIALFALAGCSAPVIDDVADANGAITRGILVVERSLADGSAPQTNVCAKFMRLSAAADPELAESVVGSPFDVPPAGECTILSPLGNEEATAHLNSLGSIELLNVGDVSMMAQQVHMPLAARAFPDVGDLVFGVFYTSHDAASDLPAPARYSFESSGSSLLERFSFDVDAPSAISNVQVGGFDFSDEVELREGVTTVVQWQTDETSLQDDFVYADVTASNGVTVRCAYPDTGQGEIAGSLLQSSLFGSLPTKATLSVHRVREMGFNATGMDVGQVRFDLSVLGHANIAAH